MPLVRFVPLGKSKSVKRGATILAAANHTGVPIGQSCSGDGICGWCRVRLLEGREHLAPPSPSERRLIHDKDFAPDERAACMARVVGDITVTTSYW